MHEGVELGLVLGVSQMRQEIREFALLRLEAAERLQTKLISMLIEMIAARRA
jgi:hypothetical protein